MDGSKTWSLVGMDGWVVDMELGWYREIIDMDLGWLVLVASMRMSMLACVFYFKKMIPITYREEQARGLLPLRIAIASNIFIF